MKIKKEQSIEDIFPGRTKIPRQKSYSINPVDFDDRDKQDHTGTKVQESIQDKIARYLFIMTERVGQYRR